MVSHLIYLSWLYFLLLSPLSRKQRLNCIKNVMQIETKYKSWCHNLYKQYINNPRKILFNIIIESESHHQMVMHHQYVRNAAL